MASSLDSSLQKEWEMDFDLSQQKLHNLLKKTERAFEAEKSMSSPQNESVEWDQEFPISPSKRIQVVDDVEKRFSSKELSSVPSINEVIVDYSNRLGDFFYSGDPLVREWFLVRNDFLPFMLSIGYVIMIKIGLRLMRNRQPFDLRKPMIIFNFSLVSIYATCLVLISFYLPTVPWELFCKGGVIRKTDPSYFLLSIGWIGYLLKYIEFLDTVFFVLRKKENLVTFLHVFHHAIVPLLAWILFRTEKSALQSIPCILNCAVHVIMYTYYGLAAMGPKVRKYLWWKKYLTQLQITQFVLIIFFVLVIAPLTGCTMVMSSYLIDIIFAPLFLVLFYRFYKSSFTHTAQKIE